MSKELNVKLKLSADGSRLVGEVRSASKALNSFEKQTDQNRQSLSEFDRESLQTERAMRLLSSSGKGVITFMTSLKGLIATAGMGYLGGQFIDAASSAEQYQIRLNRLLGSQQEGSRLFKEMATYASQVPFEYEQIMGSATQLAGVMQGGVDEITQWMPLIGDLAAVSGLSIEQTTEQVVRMYSAGAASADLFRERGILSMLGFEAGVSYSAKETRKKMVAEWQKADSKFKDTTKDLANSWQGLMSMYGDSWFRMRNDIMNDGLFDQLKTQASEVLKSINQWQDAGGAIELADDLKLAADAALTLAKITAVGGAAYLAIAALPSVIGGVSSAMAFMSLTATRASIVMGAGLGPTLTMLNTPLFGTSVAAQMAAGSLSKLQLAGSLLFAAYAGWEIGKYLSDNFVQARIAGLTFVSMMEQGFENLRYYGEILTTSLSSVWQSSIAKIKDYFADLIDKAASAASFLRFDEKAANLKAFARELRKSAGNTQTLSESLAQAAIKHEQNKAKIDSTITSLVAYELQQDKASQADKKAVADKNKLIRKTQQQQQQLADLNSQLDQLVSRVDPEERKASQYFDDIELLDQALNKNLITQQQYDELLQKVDRDFYGLNKSINTTEASLSDFSGQTDEFTVKTEKSLSQIEQIYKDTASSIRGAISGAFEDLLNGQDSFVQRFENVFKRMLADMATVAIAKPIIVPMMTNMGNMLAVSEQAQLKAISQFGVNKQTALARYGLGNGMNKGSAQSSMLAKQNAGFGDEATALTNASAKYAVNSQQLSTFDKVGKVIGNAFTGYMIGGAAAKIFDVANPEMASNLAAIGTAIAGPLGGVVGFALGSLSNGAWATTDSGYKLSYSGGQAGGMRYTTQSSKGGWFGQDRTRTQEKALNSEFSQMLNNAFDEVENRLSETAKVLGRDAKAVLNDFSSSAKLSLKGLSQQDIQKEIGNWVSNVTDEMIRQILPGIELYQKANEKLSQTYERLAASATLASNLLKSNNNRIDLIIGSITQQTLAFKAAADEVEALAQKADKGDPTDRIKLY